MINETQTNRIMKTFTANTEYQMNWIGDADMKTIIKVIKRTAKTITIKDLHSSDLKRCKIHVYDNEEYIFPIGQYSMAPTLHARRIIN